MLKNLCAVLLPQAGGKNGVLGIGKPFSCSLTLNFCACSEVSTPARDKGEGFRQVNKNKHG